MKRTFTLIFITITLLTLLFTSCNADASAGLFRQLADAKEPVGIRYKQIIGKDATHLYFLANDGIYKTNGSTTTTVKKNESNKLILETSLVNTTITYLLNNDNADIFSIQTDGTLDTPIAPTSSDLKVGFVVKRLLGNNVFLLQGNNTMDDSKSFEVTAYDVTTGNFTKKTLQALPSTSYGLVEVMQLSGRTHWELGTFNATTEKAPIILSFTDGKPKDATYVHYYVDGTNLYTITAPNERLAGFSMITNGAKNYLYILTISGDLYGCEVIAGDMTPTIMKKSSKSYKENAFMYTVSDGSTTHIITKPQTPNTAFWVFSFDNELIDQTKPVSMTEVKEGYAKHMSNVNIVSSYEIAINKLLVATFENGMFSITIDPIAANSNFNSGTSSASEAYQISW